MIFVTSFNEKLYKASGKELIESAHRVGEDRLVVCHEGNFLKTDKVMFSHRMDDDPLLIAWLRIFEKEVNKRASTYWNLNCLRWFRKLVAVECVRKRFGGSSIIWIDCDCVFLKRLTIGAWIKLRRAHNPEHDYPTITYLKGPTREIEECGFVHYDFCGYNSDAHRFFDAYLRRYMSGEFLKDPRWDDCFQFKRTRETCGVECMDIGGKTTGVFGPIFENSPLVEFLEHRKGSHARKGVV